MHDRRRRQLVREPQAQRVTDLVHRCQEPRTPKRIGTRMAKVLKIHDRQAIEQAVINPAGVGAEAV